MLFISTLALAVGAATASAQIALPSEIFGMPFGQQCQQAVLSTLANGSFAQCFPAADLLPLLTSADSIIPILDNFMTILCYESPCSNATLDAAAQQIATGCASDFQSGMLPNGTVQGVFSIYPTLREVLCTKTEDYYTEEKYGGDLGPAPIPISDAYNLTDGAFCVSSLLTQYSAYLGANLTLPYIISVATGANSTAQDLVTSTEVVALCNECIFAAVGIVQAAYPVVGSVPFATVASYANLTVEDDTATLNTLLNGTCAPFLAVNTTVLPPNITMSIVNSTFTSPLAEASD